MSKLVFGCGYLGERVARRWHDAGHEVCVVTRRVDRTEEFRQRGYKPIVADVTRPETLLRLPVAETVLFAVGVDRTSSNSVYDVYASGLGNVLASLSVETERVIYISTTGVYGTADGAWVDELTRPNPQREGGQASLAAEQVLGGHPLGRRSVVLRLAGIYGPARIPFLKELREGRPIPAPVTGWLNLVHVDDAAAIVVAADDLKSFNDGPRIYCVSDGRPVERGEFYREVARQIGAPAPRFAEPEPKSPRAARAEANRRISNSRMMAELRVTLAYPTYQAGLRAAVDTRNQ
ncbi:MAG TPA: NAD-dependent epimerase/dehydratase family protein [Lacipirellulaceae bacterium]|nr:NAD-dependent epimerase/dehydratase family protein [Lacipirellulaceae bacterium]